jgi:hypothetical protein
MENFRDALRTQRWDDHRYYHHSRINQTLHLVSAVSFLFSYVMIFKDPAISALAGWLVAMTTRQTGHFFFEPKDYDVVNRATHEYKEEIKVGYNLRRKVVLLTIWALVPLPLYFDPSFFGLFTPAADKTGFVRQVAMIWLALGIGGCCSAPCSCSSSRTFRPVSFGQLKSSPIRFTTSSFITRRRLRCCGAS